MHGGRQGRKRLAPASDDLPTAVRLAADGAVGFLRAPARRHRLGELAAVGPVVPLIRLGRRHREALVPRGGVGAAGTAEDAARGSNVVPFRRRAGRAGAP